MTSENRKAEAKSLIRDFIGESDWKETDVITIAFNRFSYAKDRPFDETSVTIRCQRIRDNALIYIIKDIVDYEPSDKRSLLLYQLDQIYFDRRFVSLMP